MANIQKVKSEEELDKVASLAYKIWNQHFVPIIGQEQVDYMVDKFQSVSAMAEQIKSGYEYFYLFEDGRERAYLAIVPDHESKKMMISKIYVELESRGKGYGLQLLEFVKKECRHFGFKTIWLTVNRFNHDTIEWYKRHGLLITEEVKADIGNGFYMDDYIMELSI